ncbi:Rieske 2Fe-2S domain-containing protein [Paraburkholderia phytofirmans]|uniref:Rieske 2Fe-2S domain-containing protein n=1 Tax=Paraburkholderia sp. BL9I2N2 TaxID=1938809 RepID=UPI0010533C10|nr:Rieske 2Fe-2S domain-containing protein [Paraburkholderia sp. BL9I2N2]TCK92219.1 phenylpropionate dioxygenase-like ring-hydroxylating dioxygenase large terminal subunit [Paraburkholderia sp. BL9I2N2]
MLSHADNEILCRIGPGTPGGNLMRRFWHPVCTSAQLPHPDCAPLRVRLLGENYVAFRDTEGKVGFLEELCMHRGASLALGRVEEGGIRCLYHGWKFSASGTVMETPNHADPKYATRMKAPAFPVREEGGIVWAYVGPIELLPAFSRYAFMDAEPNHRVVLRVNVACNYLQLVEGGEDSSHVGVLHTNMARPGWKDNEFTRNPDVINPAALASNDLEPALKIEETAFGFHYVALRKTNEPGVRNARVVPFIVPYGRIIPAPAFQFTVLEVPEHDTHTSTYIVVHGDAPVSEEKIIELLGLNDPTYYDRKNCTFTASWTDTFGQNRELMKESWTGLRGVEVEDATIGLSQGPLYDRSREHLVPADQAVVRVRRVLLDSIKRVTQNQQPPALGLDLRGVSACDRQLEDGVAWQELLPSHRQVVAA